MPFVVLRKGKTGGGFAAGIQVDEFIGNIFNRFFNLVFPVFPGLRADDIQPRRFAFVADIPLHEVRLLDRDKHRFVLRVQQVDIVALMPQRFNALNPLELPDTVVDVDNIVAGIKFHKGIDNRAFNLLNRFRDAPPPAENFVFLNNKYFQLGDAEAGIKCERQHGCLNILEQFTDTERLRIAFRKHKNTPAFLLQMR